jgi:hypothetical protein
MEDTVIAYTEVNHCSVAVRGSPRFVCMPVLVEMPARWKNHPNVGAGAKWNLGSRQKHMNSTRKIQRKHSAIKPAPRDKLERKKINLCNEGVGGVGVDQVTCSCM